MKNSIYDKLRFLAAIGLPSVTTFYLGMGQLWNFPATEKVGASLGLFNALLGSLLHVSNKKYKKSSRDVVGEIAVVGSDPDTGHPHVKLDIHGLPHELLDGKKEVRLKVGQVDMTPADSQPQEF